MRTFLLAASAALALAGFVSAADAAERNFTRVSARAQQGPTCSSWSRGCPSTCAQTGHNGSCADVCAGLLRECLSTGTWSGSRHKEGLIPR